MKWSILLALPLIWGCASAPTQVPSICEEHTATQVKMPDGTAGGVICCRQRADCYKLGTKVCGTYDITQANNSTASDFATTQQVAEYVLQCHPGAVAATK